MPNLFSLLKENRCFRALFTACMDHDSLLVMGTPRNLKLSTCSTTAPSMRMGALLFLSSTISPELRCWSGLCDPLVYPADSGSPGHMLPECQEIKTKFRKQQAQSKVNDYCLFNLKQHYILYFIISHWMGMAYLNSLWILMLK